MNWHLIDWIWHVRGCLSIPAQQTSSEVFCKIDPLFQEFGTTHELKNESLVFSKKNQPSQDKMAVFDDGVLSIERKKEGSVLQYDLRSKTLLFCFLAPFFFLAMAELTIVVKHLQKPSTEVSQSLAEKEKKEEARYLIQSPIDKALGVPAPEKKTDKDDEKQGKKKLSPVAAYVFAGIFSILYVIGRISEALSVKSLFRKYLSEY